MCGIVGIVGNRNVNQIIYNALSVLQHRGQDAAGIMTLDNSVFRLRKANGLVRDVFQAQHIQRLQGYTGIGHVRYPTAGSSVACEAQPFYVNSPYGLSLAHNGNLTNSTALLSYLKQQHRHINTGSDSEILLNLLAVQLQTVTGDLTPQKIFKAISQLQQLAHGAYAVVGLIIDHGLIAFRDPNGIRPLVLGKKETPSGVEYMLASESVALDSVGFQLIRDIAPGEGVYISFDGQLYTQQCATEAKCIPCIFEYVYFARPDSTLNNISVYASRVNMGERLGDKIKSQWSIDDIDVVIPVPETASDIALRIAQKLDLPYRQGFVKNRYIGRTFIMPEQELRKKSVRRKLNAIGAEFKGKSVLLVDDSIVRGTTSQQIVDMAKEAGATKVYFASAAPEIRFPNVYGIDMPCADELIAYGRDSTQIAQLIGADDVIFQSLTDLIEAVRKENPTIDMFETSVFDGNYITQDVDQNYLDELTKLRSESTKKQVEQEIGTNLELYNLGSL